MQNLENPITFSTIPDLLIAVLNVVIVVFIPIIVLFLIYAGFLYVTARGDEQKIKDASSALTYGVIGGVVIIGSVAILEIIKNVATGFTPAP